MQYQQIAKILQRLHWKKQEKLEDNVKDGEARLKRIYLQWGQKTGRQCAEGMDKDGIESQGLQQQTAATTVPTVRDNDGTVTITARQLES
jgi:hypothetical protein